MLLRFSSKSYSSKSFFFLFFIVILIAIRRTFPIIFNKRFYHFLFYFVFTFSEKCLEIITFPNLKTEWITIADRQTHSNLSLGVLPLKFVVILLSQNLILVFKNLLPNTRLLLNFFLTIILSILLHIILYLLVIVYLSPKKI